MTTESAAQGEGGLLMRPRRRGERGRWLVGEVAAAVAVDVEDVGDDVVAAAAIPEPESAAAAAASDFAAGVGAAATPGVLFFGFTYPG